MEASTLGTGVRTKSAASGSIHGLMGDAMRENGWTTIWRGWESTYGTTAACTRDSIRMIKNTASECIRGRMVVVMRGSGIKASSMGWALMWCLRMGS